MRSSHKKGEQRSVFDVHAAGDKRRPSQRFFRRLIYGSNVINLRQKFRTRHPWIWVAAFLVILIAIFLGIRERPTKAEVQDFNPSSCLGNWQNPANAEGVPETMSASDTSFSAENSAIYASGTEIFCGGFVPPNFATSGAITNVGLTLVWEVGDVSSTPSETGPLSTIVSSSTNTNASGTAETTSTDENISTSTSTSTPTSTLASTTPLVSPTNISTATTSVATTTSDTIEPDDVSTTTTATSTTTTTTASTSTSLNTTHSFLAELISQAFADDTDSSTDSTTISSSVATTVVGPALIANLAPLSSSSASSSASSTATTTASSSVPVPPVVVPPPTPDENFLDVSYSTDGQTWISVGQVNVNDWQQFTVTLPISAWNDLQNLQVRVEGIPTTQDPVPPVYLDGMFMEVHYNISSAIGTTTQSSTVEESSSVASATPAPPLRVTLFDPGAQQSCQVQPFSQPLPRGGSATFMVVLHPSINGVAYDILTGDLPQGITASIGSPSGAVAATSSLTLQAATSTEPGSLNIPVIYHEHESDGSVLSNFCQLNIVVQ